MANDLRGTADIVLDGKTYEVGFSIAALARLGAAFELKTFEEVHAHIQKMSVLDGPTIVSCLLRGNGHDVEQAVSDRMPPADYLKMIRTLYETAHEMAVESASDKPRPQKRQKAA